MTHEPWYADLRVVIPLMGLAVGVVVGMLKIALRLGGLEEKVTLAEHAAGVAAEAAISLKRGEMQQALEKIQAEAKELADGTERTFLHSVHALRKEKTEVHTAIYRALGETRDTEEVLDKRVQQLETRCEIFHPTSQVRHIDSIKPPHREDEKDEEPK